MLTFGVIVEGEYDAAVLPELLRKCVRDDVHVVVIVQELETWLLADGVALAAVTRQDSGRGVSAVNETLEDIADPKLRLQRLLAEAQVPYTKEVARKIAAAIDVDTLAYRCPSFRSFQQAVQDS